MSTDCDPGIMMPDQNPIKRDDGRERKHRTTVEARKALSNFCKAAWGDRAGIHIFTIPVDNERDADCILSDVIEERDRLRAAIERIANRPLFAYAGSGPDVASRTANELIEIARQAEVAQ